MSKLTNLANSLLRLDDALSVCMRCGNCQAICPVFMETGKEADVARGKIVLLQNLAYQMIENPLAVEERLSRCLLCGSCQSNCSSGVQTLEIFIEARSILTAYKKLPFLKKIIFRKLLPHPKLFANLFKFASLCQGLFFRKQNNVQKTATAPLLKPFLGARQIPSLVKNQFQIKYADFDNTSQDHKYNVLLYPGCMMEKIYPQIGEAVLKVLKHYEIGVKIPSNLVCCGMPVLASGDNMGFLNLLKKNLDVFAKTSQENQSLNDIDYIVTACPSCTETIHNWWNYYGQELSEQEKELLAKISEKSIDIHKFLIDVVKISLPEHNTNNTIKVTYHESCHLKKSLNVSEQVKQLISANPNYSLCEMENSSDCCGCGGSFTLFYPKLSEEIGQKKRDNIVNSKADCVASACPACMLQLSDILARNKDNVNVKHSMEIFADSID